MFTVADLTITSLDVIKCYSLAGDPMFELDELQNAQISNTQETQDITGKGGRKLNTLKRNKAVRVSGANGFISGGLLEAQTGGKFENKTSTPVAWRDFLVVNGNAATTEFKAVGAAGSEIEGLWVRNEDGTMGTKLTQAATAGADTFAYDPASKKLTFSDGAIENGTEIVVYYTRNIVGDVLVNDSAKYSQKMRMYIDFTAEDACSNVFHGQFYIPKADFSGNFDVDMGDNQTVHNFEIESLVGGSCVGAGGEHGALWTYTVFGVNASDAA